MNTSAKEIHRKTVHVLVALLLSVLVWFLPETTTRITLFTLLCVGLILSVLERHLHNKKKRLFLVSFFLDALEREKERKQFPGKGFIMLVSGALLTQLFFPKLLVVAGLLVLAFGDSTAHLFGKKFGRIKIPWDTTKHLEGRIIAILISSAALIIFWNSIMPTHLLWQLVLAASVALFFETLSQKLRIDDNILIQFTCALTLYLLL